ncbi:MAG: HAD family hydrolase [Candidatus Woesearchaeota archaeon]
MSIDDITKIKSQAEYKVYVTDEAGTTTPMSHYMEDAHGYARRDDITPLIADELGTNVDQVIKELDAGREVIKSDTKGYKNRPEFRRMVKISGIARSIGYSRGELNLEIFDDVPITLERLSNAGARIRVYSSGSIKSLMDGWKTSDGLEDFIETYHSSDQESTGDKLSPASYKAIARDARVDVSEMCFITDNKEEAQAAVEAGVGKVYFIDRKGKEEKGIAADGYEVIDNYEQMADDTIHEDRTEETGAIAEAEE